MTRIENNKFQVNLEEFTIREEIHEVRGIMKFQITQKKLEFKCYIDDNVPRVMISDKKRYKQVLFNLIGNAVKFTFKGEIKMRVSMQESMLVTEV